MILIVGVTLLSYTWYQFKSIESENNPYLFNKKQVLTMYKENKEVFDSVANYISDSEEEYIVSDFMPEDQEKIRIAFPNASEQFYQRIEYILNDLKMTDIFKQKDDDYIMIYQNKPTVYNDIEIGLTYQISAGKWRYYYYHNYNICSHKHKFIYKLYDFMFNKETDIK